MSEKTVRKGIQNGRLERSVGRDAKGRPVITDPDLAEREWRANADPSRGASKATSSSARARDDASTIARARRRLITAQARREELRVAQQEGKLVPAVDVDRRWSAIAAEQRTKWLGFATWLKQAIPGLSISQVAAIDARVRENLEGLADGAT